MALKRAETIWTSHLNFKTLCISETRITALESLSIFLSPTAKYKLHRLIKGTCEFAFSGAIYLFAKKKKTTAVDPTVGGYDTGWRTSCDQQRAIKTVLKIFAIFTNKEYLHEMHFTYTDLTKATKDSHLFSEWRGNCKWENKCASLSRSCRDTLAQKPQINATVTKTITRNTK